MDKADPARPPADDPGDAFSRGYGFPQLIVLGLALALFVGLWLSPALPGLPLGGPRAARVAAAMEKTGLALALAKGPAGVEGWAPFAIVVLVTAVMTLATAPTSDTSTATVSLPVSGPLAIGLNQPVRRRSAPVTLAASADFALPVGTPPNAVAAGSGLVSLGRRVRAGIGVNQRFALLLPTLL